MFSLQIYKIRHRLLRAARGRESVDPAVDYMKKIWENPFFPVPVDEYARLYDFAITGNGVIYLDRLREEFLSGKMPEDKCLHLILLSLADSVSKKSIDMYHDWQEMLHAFDGRVNLDKPGIKEALMQMGCVEENQDYNPKLYKSHLLWKSKTEDEIERLEKQHEK